MRYADIIRQLTQEEKCALLTGKDVFHTRAIERLNIPSICLSDGPSGLRHQEGSGNHLGLGKSAKATCYPSASALANSWDASVTEDVGRAIGQEARWQGVQVVLGPGLNTKRSPLCGRNFEYYSEDPYLSGKLAAGFIRGLQDQGVAACPKHFAANSQETRRMSNDSVVDERTLKELYLTNFEIAVKEGMPRAVMSAYNRVNGVYANENPYLLDETLRRAWGFRGAVISDWGGSNDFVEGVRAGCSLEMPGTGDDSACQLATALQEGRITEDQIDERLDDLLFMILGGQKDGQARFEPDKWHATAREAAAKSIVLLKNEDGLLPLNPLARIAIIGDFALTPRYQGAGSSAVNPHKVVRPLDALMARFPNAIGFARGFTRDDTDSPALTAEAVALARQAECVVVCMGLPEVYESEGLDRRHMRIPGNQARILRALAEANPQIVVVFSGGCAVEMPWLSHCRALLWGGLLGQAGAEAIAGALMGDVCPGGKLAETFPLCYEDLPVSRYYPGQGRTSEYREGLYVGYRYTETVHVPVRFPFGFGLSYTTFEYDHLQINKEGASFDLTNTGACQGSEIAQLYVSLPQSHVFRPIKELKGFQRVSLAPGEKKRVTIPLDDKAFRYFNIRTRQFETEGGTYHICVGASASDIRLEGTWTVQDSGAPLPYESLNLISYLNARVMSVSDTEYQSLLGRALPAAMPAAGEPLDMNDAVDQWHRAKNPLARLIHRRIKARVERCAVAGKPSMNTHFIYNLPFRGIAKLMNGMVSLRMAEGLLIMANGHFFKGLGMVIHGFITRPRLGRKVKRNDSNQP